MKTYPFIILFAGILFSAFSLDKNQKSVDTDWYRISYEDISQKVYEEEKAKYGKSLIYPHAIKDLDSIRLMLGDLITLKREYDYWAVKEIKDRQGNILLKDSISDPIGIEGYFPDEDILITEYGNSVEGIFNLTTGATDADAGRPIFIASPNGKYQIRSFYYGGDDTRYFLFSGDSKSRKKAKTSLPINGIVFYYCSPAFWANDSTFFIKNDNFYEERGKYQKYTISPYDSRLTKENTISSERIGNYVIGDDMKKIFGEYEEDNPKYEISDSYKDTVTYSLKRKGIELTIYEKGDQQLLVSGQIKNAEYRTTENIGVGSTVEELFKVYPNAKLIATDSTSFGCAIIVPDVKDLEGIIFYADANGKRINKDGKEMWEWQPTSDSTINLITLK